MALLNLTMFKVKGITTKKQSKKQSSLDGKGKKQHETKSDVIFLGTTTFRRMESATYDPNDPLNSRKMFNGSHVIVDDKVVEPCADDDVVYVYYHPEENQSVMTNVKDDYYGVEGTGAGFEGKIEL